MDLDKLQQLANTPAQATSYSHGLAQAAMARATVHVGRVRLLASTAGLVTLVSAVAAVVVLSGAPASPSPIPNSEISAASSATPSATRLPPIASEDVPSAAQSPVPNKSASNSQVLSTPTPSKTSVVPGLPVDVDRYDDETDGDLPGPLATPSVSYPAMPSDTATPVASSPPPVSITPPAELPLGQPSTAPSKVSSPTVPTSGLSSSAPRAQPATSSVSIEELLPTISSQVDPTDVSSAVNELIEPCGDADIAAEYVLPEANTGGRVTNAVRLRNVGDRPCWLIGVLNAKLSFDSAEPLPLGSAIKLDYLLESRKAILVRVSYTIAPECLRATGTVTATIAGLGDYQWPNSYFNECSAIQQ